MYSLTPSPSLYDYKQKWKMIPWKLKNESEIITTTKIPFITKATLPIKTTEKSPTTL